MPHRIPLLVNAMSYTLEGLLLASLTAWTGVKTLGAAISEADWKIIKGPEGALFLSVIIIVVLWNTGRTREKNENKRREDEEGRRERRHAEQLSLQKENSDKLLALTSESIKAHAMAVAAVSSFDRTIRNLTEELKDRPCQKVTPKTADAA